MVVSRSKGLLPWNYGWVSAFHTRTLVKSSPKRSRENSCVSIPLWRFQKLPYRWAWLMEDKMFMGFQPVKKFFLKIFLWALVNHLGFRYQGSQNNNRHSGRSNWHFRVDEFNTHGSWKSRWCYVPCLPCSFKPAVDLPERCLDFTLWSLWSIAGKHKVQPKLLLASSLLANFNWGVPSCCVKLRILACMC